MNSIFFFIIESGQRNILITPFVHPANSTFCFQSINRLDIFTEPSS